jgi:hypothetical protein
VGLEPGGQSVLVCQEGGLSNCSEEVSEIWPQASRSMLRAHSVAQWKSSSASLNLDQTYMVGSSISPLQRLLQDCVLV